MQAHMSVFNNTNTGFYRKREGALGVLKKYSAIYGSKQWMHTNLKSVPGGSGGNQRCQLSMMDIS